MPMRGIFFMSAIPVRVFSSEVDAGSREESAIKQDVTMRDRFDLKRSRTSS
jgi:hypothetical protein